MAEDVVADVAAVAAAPLALVCSRLTDPAQLRACRDQLGLPPLDAGALLATGDNLAVQQCAAALNATPSPPRAPPRIPARPRSVTRRIVAP